MLPHEVKGKIVGERQEEEIDNTLEMTNDGINFDVHIKYNETIQEPQSIVRTKIVDDKIVIDKRLKKIIIEYRVGNIDSKGNFIDIVEEQVVFRDEDYDIKIAEILDTSPMLFAKNRIIAKEDRINKLKPTNSGEITK